MRSNSVPILVLVVILFSGIITNTHPITAFELADDSPIIISSNNDFLTHASSGSGTLEDPYIIEDLVISGSAQCIVISTTDAHFIIRNCELTASQSYYAIYIYNSTNGIIKDCHIWNSYIGILLVSSNNTVIENCIINSCSSPISISHSGFCEITNNTLTPLNGQFNGIGIYNSFNITVSQNHIDSMFRGLYLQYSLGVIISNNSIVTEYGVAVSISNSDAGILTHNLVQSIISPPSSSTTDILEDYAVISMEASNIWSLTDNTITGIGLLSLYTASCHDLFVQSNNLNSGIYPIMTTGIFEDNLVLGKPLGLFEDLIETELDGSLYGQLILTDCWNVSITGGYFVSAPMIIEHGYNVTISNCEIENGTYAGVFLTSSYICHISDSTISGSTIGINLAYSDYCHIEDCTVSGSESGVLLSHSSYAKITDCLIECNSYAASLYHHDEYSIGVRIQNSPYAVVTNNQIDSVSLLQTFYGTFTNNDLVRGFLFFDSAPMSSFNISANTIESRPIEYVNFTDNSHIDGSTLGQIILQTCNNITIDNYQMNNVTAGLQILYSYNTVIDNVDVTNSYIGIRILYSQETTITNSDFERIAIAGIDSIGSDLMEVSNVIVYGSHIGVRLSGNINSITNSEFIDNEYGIYLDESNYSNVTDCLFKRIAESGIYLDDAHYCRLIGNRLVRCDWNGVRMTHRSSHNTAYLNEFVNSGVWDSGTNNTWDNGIDTGNWWYDYSGTGVYIVDYENVDHWPMVYELTYPILSSHDDITFTLSQSMIIIWDAFDSNPDIYRVYIDDSLYILEDWDGESITIDVSHLSVGTYVLRLEIEDDDGSIDSGGIVVYIEPAVNPLGDPILLLGVGSVLSVVVLAGFLWRRQSLHSV